MSENIEPNDVNAIQKEANTPEEVPKIAEATVLTPNEQLLEGKVNHLSEEISKRDEELTALKAALASNDRIPAPTENEGKIASLEGTVQRLENDKKELLERCQEDRISLAKMKEQLQNVISDKEKLLEMNKSLQDKIEQLEKSLEEKNLPEGNKIMESPPPAERKSDPEGSPDAGKIEEQLANSLKIINEMQRENKELNEMLQAKHLEGKETQPTVSNNAKELQELLEDRMKLQEELKTSELNWKTQLEGLQHELEKERREQASLKYVAVFTDLYHKLKEMGTKLEEKKLKKDRKKKESNEDEGKDGGQEIKPRQPSQSSTGDNVASRPSPPTLDDIEHMTKKLESLLLLMNEKQAKQKEKKKELKNKLKERKKAGKEAQEEHQRVIHEKNELVIRIAYLESQLTVLEEKSRTHEGLFIKYKTLAAQTEVLVKNESSKVLSLTTAKSILEGQVASFQQQVEQLNENVNKAAQKEKDSEEKLAEAQEEMLKAEDFSQKLLEENGGMKKKIQAMQRKLDYILNEQLVDMSKKLEEKNTEVNILKDMVKSSKTMLRVKESELMRMKHKMPQRAAEETMSNVTYSYQPRTIHENKASEHLPPVHQSASYRVSLKTLGHNKSSVAEEQNEDEEELPQHGGGGVDYEENQPMSENKTSFAYENQVEEHKSELREEPLANRLPTPEKYDDTPESQRKSLKSTPRGLESHQNTDPGNRAVGERGHNVHASLEQEPSRHNTKNIFQYSSIAQPILPLPRAKAHMYLTPVKVTKVKPKTGGD